MDVAGNSWSRFEKSGKLIDYLIFCEERRQRAARSDDGAEARLPEADGAPQDQSSL